MSIHRPGAFDAHSRPGVNPRLLPTAVETSVRDWAFRLAGCALVAGGVLAWISMLSWTVSDPSLTHATAQPTRNLLGPLGAAGSDLMIQTLGVAAVFVLIGPMIWGLELLTNTKPIPRFGVKMLAFPIAVLALAGALSGLPTMSFWPLHNGFGGMLGDIIYNMCTMVVVGISPDRGSSFAGTGLGGLGLGLLLHSLGFGLEHVSAIMPGRKVKQDAAAANGAPSEPSEMMKPATVDREPPNLPMPMPVAPPVSTAPGPMAPIPATAAAYSPLDEGFDRETDERARAVAERFAHKQKTRRTERDGGPRMSAAPAKSGRAAAPAPTSPTFRLAPAHEGLSPRPSLDLLDSAPDTTHVNALHAVDADARAGLLIDVLADFGVEGVIRDIKPGPVVTRYEFEPARGVKTARVVGLADDIARSLGVHSIRIAVVPGRNAIGVEVPNTDRRPVLLSDVLASEAFRSSPAALPLALGRGIAGEPIVADLARMPHLLIAGTTGSGKSVGVNAMILSLIFRLDPSQCRLLLIDPKMLELAAYNVIPHLLAPVVTDPHAAAEALDWVVGEMEARYQRMAKLGVRNIEGFNARARRSREDGQDLVRTVQTGFDPATGTPIFEHERLDGEPMPYIVVVVDEFADLMMTAGDRVEGAIQRLAQMARAAGIHLIMSTQRPSVDVVTGTIKANFPMRISFRVASRTDSRTILDEAGAEQLLGHGDMLITSGAGQCHRVHGAFVSDEEIARVVGSFGAQFETFDSTFGATREATRAATPERRPAPTRTAAAKAQDRAPRTAPHDQIYADAIAVVLADRKVSTGHLHRTLAITEAMAAELIARMEGERLVGPLDRFGRRKILMTVPSPPAAAGRRSVA